MPRRAIVGGTDVVAGARVHRRLVEHQPIQRDDFVPGQLVGGTPAHGCNVAQHRQVAIGAGPAECSPRAIVTAIAAMQCP
jgi:hypothetical protein